MAYLYDGKGPYPNKKGEFCGNAQRTLLILAEDGITVEKCSGRTVYGKRIGKPSSCKIHIADVTLAVTSNQMAKIGYVGLYLTKDQPHSPEDIEIDTDALLEEVVSSKGRRRYRS